MFAILHALQSTGMPRDPEFHFFLLNAAFVPSTAHVMHTKGHELWHRLQRPRASPRAAAAHGFLKKLSLVKDLWHAVHRRTALAAAAAVRLGADVAVGAAAAATVAEESDAFIRLAAEPPPSLGAVPAALRFAGEVHSLSAFHFNHNESAASATSPTACSLNF